jgi:hypothetical protein
LAPRLNDSQDKDLGYDGGEIKVGKVNEQTSRALTSMGTDNFNEILLTDFAIRSFRNVADYDYTTARMAYRAKLVPQFLWLRLSLQAIEKYFKCILLLNRIPAKHVGHILCDALKLLEQHAPFELRLKVENEISELQAELARKRETLAHTTSTNAYH